MSDEAEQYRVGYRRPPKHSQFRKGQSGNPGGRPKKRGSTELDLGKLLDRPLTVKVDGEPRAMSSKEVELRQLVDKAIKKGDLTAIAYLLELFVKHGAVEPPQRAAGGVVEMPSTVPWAVGEVALAKFGPPPWTKKQLAPIKAAYLEIRTELERIIDEIMEYDL